MPNHFTETMLIGVLVPSFALLCIHLIFTNSRLIRPIHRFISVY
ncbi:hypothetical protein LINPERPRIM_LOCUS26108, partial [Linum perenne]